MYCSRKDCLTRADKPQKKKRLGSGSVSQSQNYFSFKKQKKKRKGKKDLHTGKGMHSEKLQLLPAKHVQWIHDTPAG